MGEIWYATGAVWWANPIEVANVVKATEKQVTVQFTYGTRQRSRRDYFPTWVEARDALVARSEKSVAEAEVRLERERSFLAKIKALEEPT